MSQTSERVREMFGKGDDVRDRGLTTPDGIMRWDNIAYGPERPWQLLDVYKPHGPKERKMPVIISVHGGGWVYGDKERYQYYCMDLAQRGFAVVNFNYRLAPEWCFPASLEDTCMVFSWVLEHAEEYGFDTDHIFAAGDSAGAHILGLVTAMCTNIDYAANFSFAPPAGFVPKALALNCGAYWIRISDRPEDQLTTQLMKDFLPNQGSEEELALIDVRKHITHAFPPVFFMTAEGDFLKSHALDLAAVLSEQEIPFVYRYYQDAARKLGHVFHLNIRLEMAKQCNDEECAFFQSF